MNKKQFLKNFKNHCEIARDLGIYSKVAMIESLENKVCPFTERNFIRGIDLKDVYKKREKLYSLVFYWPAADWYEQRIIKPKSQMISILKSIPWRI